jgi:hypothetical protein
LGLFIPAEQEKGTEKKKGIKEKTGKNYPSLLFGQSSQVQVQHSVRAMQYMRVYAAMRRRCYLVKSSCHL